ncbi:MAG: polyprenol monophosphomannose synthase [Bergeyella sp.]|nr:polyprenol monophosphomannose synthase [Bergeyella sp.]
MEKLVIIPTYNEKENVVQIIETVFSLEQGYHILIVDDSSPDGTAILVNKLQEKFFGQLFLLVRPSKEGLGKAYLDGFRWAMERNYDYVFEMDADFSHSPSDLNLLFEHCKNADMSVGSRYVNGVNVVNWPMGRVLLSFLASKYVQLVLGLSVHDATAGFVCFKKETLRQLDLEKVKLKGYGFQVEIKYRAYKKGLRIVEVPIIFTNRERGESKMSGKIIGEAVLGILQLRWKSLVKTL